MLSVSLQLLPSEAAEFELSPMSLTSHIPSTPGSQAKPDKDTESGIEHV